MLQGTSPARRTAFTAALLPASRTWPLSSMCFIVLHPAFEEIINSPISSRIVEVYCHSGDSVEAGTPLLLLDLKSTENEYKKLLDEKEIRRNQLEQLRLRNKTEISNQEMNIKINAMELDRLEAELRNERYLDSIGSGTADKVRQAEMAVQTARLRLEQQREQLKNDKEIKASNVKVQELEFAIFTKKLEEMKRYSFHQLYV